MISKFKEYSTHIFLFAATVITTLYSGMLWIAPGPGPWTLSEWSSAIPYAGSILLFLSCHEFGHYFAAKYHKVNSTLPYYIPFPPIPWMINFGTFGAVIKTKSRIESNKAMFDIGIAGPLAGFVAALAILIYGFSNLPGPEYITNIHPDYFTPGYKTDKGLYLEFGAPLLYSICQKLFSSPGDFLPPMSEMYHYPYLLSGWFGLFVTSLNMIPVGQLDGGHIFYAMFGEKKHTAFAHIIVILMFVAGMLGILESFFEINTFIGWSGWIVWVLMLVFVIKIKHPPAYTFEKLNTGRIILGYISFAILILSFIPVPIIAY